MDDKKELQKISTPRKKHKQKKHRNSMVDAPEFFIRILDPIEILASLLAIQVETMPTNPKIDPPGTINMKKEGEEWS